MQTFLPYADFDKSARILDYKRLGKQRVEASQILAILLDLVWSKELQVYQVRPRRKPKSRWANHVCTRSWNGFERALATYGLACCREWIARGYKDTMTARFEHLKSLTVDTGLPPWIGRESVHISHQSNLRRKNEAFYGPLFPDVPCNLPYEWPVPLYTQLRGPYCSSLNELFRIKL